MKKERWPAWKLTRAKAIPHSRQRAARADRGPIEEFGFTSPIPAEPDGLILACSLLSSARKLKMTGFPVTRLGAPDSGSVPGARDRCQYEDTLRIELAILREEDSDPNSSASMTSNCSAC
jgi:hypothetical protein